MKEYKLQQYKTYYEAFYTQVLEAFEYYDKEHKFPPSEHYRTVDEYANTTVGITYALTNRLFAKKGKYKYFITFTLKSKDLYEKAKELVYAIGQRKEALTITKFEIVEETTKQGMPHWHVLVHSEKCIKKNRFNTYTQKYGFIQIKPITTANDDEIINYINKENVSQEL